MSDDLAKEAAYYARQIQFDEIGQAGQARLKAARVLIVGVGGLGASASLALAGAGIGTIGLVDGDHLESHNLHRQFLYAYEDVGESKVALAAARLRSLNPFIEIIPYRLRLDAGQAARLLPQYDVILDCSDNFTTKYLLNDAAILLGKALILASVYRFEGQLHIINPGGEAGCLRCLWPEKPDEDCLGSCAEIGIIGAIPAVLGTLQALEAIKLILGLPSGASDGLIIWDGIQQQMRRVARQRDLSCPLCGETPTIKRLAEHFEPVSAFTIDAAELRPAGLAAYRWLDLREPAERREGPALPDVIHVPFSSIDLATVTLEKLVGPDAGNVLAICVRGQRSHRLAKALRDRGETRIWSLKAGAAALKQ